MSLNKKISQIFPSPGNALSNHFGIEIRERTRKKIMQHSGSDSLWFPYGQHGFGGYYSKSGLDKELSKLSNGELGTKGLKLRAIVAGVVLSLTGAGLGIKSSMENPVPKIGTTMTTPTKK